MSITYFPILTYYGKRMVLLSLTSFPFIVQTQDRKNTIQFDIISVGVEVNPSQKQNAQNEIINPISVPVIGSGISYFRQLNRKWMLGIGIDFHTGSLKRDFEYTMADSTGPYYEKKVYQINFISYGVGLKSKLKINNRLSVTQGISYYSLSVQSIHESISYDNQTSNIVYSESVTTSNDLSSKTNLALLIAGLEYNFGKKMKNSFNIRLSQTVFRPLHGSLQYKLNNNILENSSFKINYCILAVGYSRILKF
jgi:hypothetical protein